MRDHTLIYYLDSNSTLTPDASLLRDVSTAKWWKALEPHFDELIWQYYGEREVFLTDKFDPRNPTDTIKNIIRSFAINLKTKAYKYERLFNIAYAEYEPLYNVDAFEFEDRELKQTGTNEHKKTGTDTQNRTGKEMDQKTGKEANTRTGSEETDYTGTDVETTSRTTYDSDVFYGVEKKENAPDQRADTHKYNQVKDETSYTDRRDTHTYDNVKDETKYNSADTENRNLKDDESIKKRRYGNIGITASQDLVKKEIDLWGGNFDWMKKIVAECVNCVSYAIY